MKYRYILFDIDGTLINFPESFRKAAEHVLTRAGVAATKENIDTYFRYNDDMWFGLNMGNVESEYILNNYHPLYEEYIYQAAVKSKEGLNMQGTADELALAFKKAIGEYAVPHPNSVEVCKELCKEHVLCIATNGLNSVQPGKITAYKDCFEHIFISEALGCIKPTPKYFNKILKMLNADASECIMVGDSLPNDIDGANKSGIASCYYNPLELENNSGIIPTYEIRDFNELFEIV